jgi:hypothetical protein
MTDEQTIKFVQTSALALGLPADEARVARVAAHFKRTEAMAQLLDQVNCPADLEIAEIYCPKLIAP